MEKMVDQIVEGLDSCELTSKIPEGVLAEGTMNQPACRICVECGATKTPLWRCGPAGPKSLCNACGIRSRKQKGALLGLSNRKEKKGLKKPKKNSNSNMSTATSDGSSKKRPESPVFMPREEVLDEVEAAMLLMAMAYDTPFFA